MKNYHLMSVCRAMILFCWLTLPAVAMGNDWHTTSIYLTPGVHTNFSAQGVAPAASSFRASASCKPYSSSTYSPTMNRGAATGVSVISTKALSSQRNRGAFSTGQGGVASMAFQQPIHSGHYATAAAATTTSSTPPGITIIRRSGGDDDDEEDDNGEWGGTGEPHVPIGSPGVLIILILFYLLYKTTNKNNVKQLFHKISFILLLCITCTSNTWAATYYYRGIDNVWGATAMTVSTDGLYEYHASSNNYNEFKIALSSDKWNYNNTYLNVGFNGTNVTETYNSSDNCGVKHTSKFYILVYYPNTSINTTDKPIICASTTLPNIEFYIKHNWNGSNTWTWQKMTSNGDGTFSYIGIYGGTGCNYNTKGNDSESKWVASPTLNGTPSIGDQCIFTLDPLTGTITITKYIVAQDYYIKHNWDGGTSSWEQMQVNSDGTYSYTGYYGAGSSYYNTQSKDNKQKQVTPTLVGNPSAHDECVFTFNPSGNTLTITKIPVVTYNFYVYTQTTYAWVDYSYLGLADGHQSHYKNGMSLTPVSGCPGWFSFSVTSDIHPCYFCFYGGEDTKANATCKWDGVTPFNKTYAELLEGNTLNNNNYIDVKGYNIVNQTTYDISCDTHNQNQETGNGQDCGYSGAVEGTYYVTGDGWCGTAWTLTQVNGTVMEYKGNGLYEKTFTNVPAGEHLFKISNGTWSSVDAANGHEWGAKEVDVCSGNVVTISDDSQYDNISYNIASARNVTVHFCYSGDPSSTPSVCVTFPLVVEYSAETGGSASATYNSSAFTSGEMVDYASTVTLTATPSSGYKFLGWYDNNGNQISTLASYNAVILEDCTFTARFVEITTTLNTYTGYIYKNATINLNTSEFTAGLNGILTWTLIEDPQAYQYATNPDGKTNGGSTISPFATPVPHTATLGNDGSFSSDWEGKYVINVSDGTNSNKIIVYVYTIMFKHPWCEEGYENVWRWHEVLYDENKDQIYFQAPVGNYLKHGINIVYNYYGGLDDVDDYQYFFKVLRNEVVYYTYKSCSGSSSGGSGSASSSVKFVGEVGSNASFVQNGTRFEKTVNINWTGTRWFKLNIDGSETGYGQNNGDQTFTETSSINLAIGSGSDIRLTSTQTGDYTFIVEGNTLTVVYPGDPIPAASGSGTGSGTGTTTIENPEKKAIYDGCNNIDSCTYAQFLYYPETTLKVDIPSTLEQGYIVIEALPNIILESSLGTSFEFGKTTNLTATPDNVPEGFRPDYVLTVTNSEGEVVLTYSATGTSNTASVGTNWHPTRPGIYTFSATMTFEGITYDASIEIEVTPVHYYLNTSANGTYQEMTYIEEDNVYHLCTNQMPFNGNLSHISKDQSSVYQTYDYTSGPLVVTNPDNLTPAAQTYCLWIYDPENSTLTVRGQVCRIKSVSQYGTFYSNAVSTIAEPISFFADPEGECFLMVYNLRSLKWQTYEINIEAGKLGAGNVSGVYHTYFTDFDETLSDITSTWTLYTGDFYIYSSHTIAKYDAANMSDATMTEFTPGNSAPEYFNHYWVRNIPDGTDAGACVGDDVNMCLSDTIFPIVLDQGDAVIRYAYNDHNNIFDLSAMDKPSTSTLSYMKGFGVNTEADDAENGITFREVGDQFCYEVDILAKANSVLSVGSKYGDKLRYPFCPADRNSAVTNSADVTYPLVGSVLVNGTANSAEEFNVRVEYDFKTNRLLAGWAPSAYKAQNAGSKISVEANLFVIREGQETPEILDAAQTGEIIIPAGKQVYLFMEVEKAAVDAAYGLTKTYYYMSLPFSAKISDMYGLGTYKTNWIVQRYRGDTRAANGYTNGTTFWKNLTATATLTQGRGYVFGIVPPSYTKVTDFVQNTSIQRARIYAPRDGVSEYHIVQPRFYNDTTISQYACTIAGKENDDSNWHVLGIPGLVGVTGGSSFSEISGYVGLDDATAPNYVYTWNGDYDGFEVSSTTGFTFEPTKSYFVQYYGNIRWTSANKKNILAQEKPQGQNSQVALGLYNDNGKRLDQTFVSFTQDGSAGYDMSRDLVKMATNHTQLSSIFGGMNLAALDLPANHTGKVALQVLAANAESLTFSLEDASIIASGRQVILFDSLLNIYTNLMQDEYMVDLTAGTHDGRFFILIDEAPAVTTDVETTAGRAFTAYTVDGKLVVSGFEGTEDIRLYDAAGKQIISCLAGAGQAITLPSVPAGIYVVRVGENAQKLNIR